MRYKRILPNLYTLVNILNDLQSHSGEQIAGRLKISRNAVWKMIKFMEKENIEIEKKLRKGYQLKQPLFLLERSKILSLLPKKQREQISLEIYLQLPSTNTYFLENNEQDYTNPVFCLAEMQTAGKGRLGRTWQSPFAQNIYMSCRWDLPCDISKLSGLSLVVGLALCEALKSFDVEGKLALKWPNDILYDGKKLGGILIEMLAEAHGHCSVIIGIGLNVNMQQQDIDQAWTSLAKICGKHLNRNDIVAKLIKTLLQYLAIFIQKGMQEFKSLWKQYDELYQKNITLNHQGKKIKGKAVGIDNMGQLQIERADKTTISCAAGETTLSRANRENHKD